MVSHDMSNDTLSLLRDKMLRYIVLSSLDKRCLPNKLIYFTCNSHIIIANDLLHIWRIIFVSDYGKIRKSLMTEIPISFGLMIGMH